MTATMPSMAQLADEARDHAREVGRCEPFPPEVAFVLSSLEAGPRPIHDRQKLPRIAHRVRATLRLYSDAATPLVLYTRHVNAQAVGFLVDRQLPLSHGGVVDMIDLDGQVVCIACTVLRCRPACDGWYEGALHFVRAQRAFEPADWR